MSGSAKPPLERLLRGISTNHVETVRDAWRALLADGAPSVPAVLDKLDSAAWKDRPRGPTGPYLGLLLALLDELDPAAFVAEIDRMRESARADAESDAEAQLPIDLADEICQTAGAH